MYEYKLLESDVIRIYYIALELVWPARPIPPLLFTMLRFMVKGKGLATFANELM